MRVSTCGVRMLPTPVVLEVVEQGLGLRRLQLVVRPPHAAPRRLQGALAVAVQGPGAGVLAEGQAALVVCLGAGLPVWSWARRLGEVVLAEAGAEVGQAVVVPLVGVVRVDVAPLVPRALWLFEGLAGWPRPPAC